MNYGLYTIFLGMRSRQNTLDVQANNIANASTAGFKAERLVYRTFEAASKGTSDTQGLVLGVSTTSWTDLKEGSMQETGNSMDVAIKGDGFLQVQTPGGVRYTRVGNLTQNANGQLVTKNGDLVVGGRGPITVPSEGKLKIGADGSLSSDDQQVDTLKLVRFNNPVTALMKDGDTMFKATGLEQPQDATDSKIVQGAIENSNVNPISEMVAMINNNREFESLEKSLTVLMNDVGRKISGELGKLS